MKQFLTIAKNLLFPPRCGGCHALLPPTATGEHAVFCPDCEKEWRAELCLQCPKCFAAYPECRCQSVVLTRAGSVGLVKLAPYGDNARERVVHRIVLDMKRKPRRRIVALLARELGAELLKELEKLGWERERVMLTHLPRDVRSVRREGTDQAQVLAKALAKETQLCCRPLLYRTKHVKTQKKLSAKERERNLRDVFAVREIPNGCRVVLVDDVVTTGASMSAAVRVLRAAGVKEILCVGVAQTRKKR